MEELLERADVQKVADKLLNVVLAAARAKVNRLTIYRWTQSGQLPVITTSGGLRVWEPDLDSYLVRRRYV